jgi:8-oxo-dGTP diphosphatase
MSSAAHGSDTRRDQLSADVRLLLIDPAGRALLGLRQNTGLLDGEYDLPAADLEAGESVIQAAIRAARDGLGITVDPEHVEFVHVMHSPLSGGRASFCFRIRRWTGIVVNRDRRACAGLRWFPFDHLPETVASTCRAGFEHTAAGAPFSASGGDEAQPDTRREADHAVVRNLSTAPSFRTRKAALTGHPAA